MDITRDYLLETLKAHINDSENITSPPEEMNWQEFYKLANAHKVFPMVYDRLYKLSEIQELPEGMRMQQKHIVRMTIVQQIMKTQAFLAVCQKLLDAGVKVLVVKGIICRNIYPKPDARISSDEDLFVEDKNFRKAHDILIACGLTMQQGDDLDSSQVVTYTSQQSGLHIELHRELFSRESEAYGKLNKAFKQAFDHAIQIKIQKIPVWTMCSTEHLLYLIFHGFKHFLHSGFGIRQVCDIVLFARKYGEEIDWKWLMEQAEEFHAAVFVMNIFDIGEKYLGIRLEEMFIPQEIIDKYCKEMECSRLLDDILDAGVYGSSSMERQHSSRITLNAVISEGKGGSRGNLLRTLFPKAKEIEGRFHYLRKYPYLLPVAWMQRLAGYMKERKATDGNSAKQSLEIGTQRVELFKKYKIIR